MYELRCELVYCLCPTYVSSCSVVMLNFYFLVYELIWSAAMLNFLFACLCINLLCSHTAFFLVHGVQESAVCTLAGWHLAQGGGGQTARPGT